MGKGKKMGSLMLCLHPSEYHSLGLKSDQNVHLYLFICEERKAMTCEKVVKAIFYLQRRKAKKPKKFYIILRESQNYP